MIKAVSPNNLGWLEKKLSRQEKIHLWECIESGGKDLKENLAGNISTSHVIPDTDDWFFNNTLIELIERYVWIKCGLTIRTNMNSTQCMIILVSIVL